MSKTVLNKEVLYGYKRKIERLHARLDDELSPENAQLLKKYDRELIKDSCALATRLSNVQRVLGLTRRLKKNWSEATKVDLEELIIKIVEEFADNGQETDVTYDFKRSLKTVYYHNCR